MPTHGYPRRGKRRFADDELTFIRRDRHRARLPAEDAADATDGLPEGDRWSTWDQSPPAQRGPRPYPDWLVTDLAAVDTELGILKTGKEAEVFLVRRAVPETQRSCLLAAKRYRNAEHRMFQRDSQYLEGRKVRASRDNRAMAKRTAAGRAMIATQWAEAEFAALSQLSRAGLPVPYPVQVLGTELLLEFIGDPDGTPAPRLAETRPDPASLMALWDQLVPPLVQARPARFRPRRPIGLQPAGPSRPPAHDRHAASRRHHRQPTRRRIHRPGRNEHRPLVRRSWPGRLRSRASRPGGRAPG